VTQTTALPSLSVARPPRPTGPSGEGPVLHIVPWIDPVADPHGVHPCSRYVELYWLGVIGPSTTWLLRRLSYGLEVRRAGFDIDLAETARCLGLGERMGKNSPFRRALQRLCSFELARPQGPGSLAVRTRVPPLPLRHLSRLSQPLQASHRRWLTEQRLPEPEQIRRRAGRLAAGLAAAGRERLPIEQQLGEWGFHPSVAFSAARAAVSARDRARGADGKGADGRPGRGGVAPGEAG
jgi:hypothetical protein